MSVVGFTNGQVLTRDADLPGAAFVLDGESIAAIEGRGDDALDLEGGWIVPGFIDTQVNGGGGVLFNDRPDVDAIARIGAAHAPYGTTAFLPTLISVRLPVIAQALEAVDQAIGQGVPGVIGVHVEGPFLNASRKGIHDEANFRPLDAEALALLTAPRKGKVMVTLAPEQNDPAAIRTLVAAGVIVSIGHSNATYAQAREAIDAGASGVTHLYNAMSPLHHREPGVVGAALEDRSLYCGLIIDGAHMHPAAARIALAARPKDRFLLVTDAMPSVGNATKDFVLNGKPITVRDGVCVNEAGTLAGSDLDMARAVRNTHDLGVPLREAVAMAAANPAAFLGLGAERGELAVGQRADFVWLDRNLRARGTWIGGQRVA